MKNLSKQDLLSKMQEDILRIQRNTATFFANFIRFSANQKEPFSGSYLSFNLDENKYQWFSPSKEKIMMIPMDIDAYKKDLSMNKVIKYKALSYYPMERNIILMTPNIQWMYEMCDDARYGRKPEAERLTNYKDLSEHFYKWTVGVVDLEINIIRGIRNGFNSNESKNNPLF